MLLLGSGPKTPRLQLESTSSQGMRRTVLLKKKQEKEAESFTFRHDQLPL